jgi:rhodanese-related sulfurtransferase
MLVFMLNYEISGGDLRYLLAAGSTDKIVLLDVREPWEFEEARIEGSVLMPLGEVQSHAQQELDPQARVIVICHHGRRSMSATAWLREQGFEQAQSLRGGIDGWSAAIDPSIPRY